MNDVNAGEGLVLEIRDNGLTATLRGSVDSSFNRSEIHKMITDLLRDKGVTFGLSSQDMLAAVEALDQGETLQGAVLARGKPAQPGQDARLEILVEIDKLVAEEQKNGEKIDFRDRGQLPVVQPGTPIARLHPATKGLIGRDVTGKQINPPRTRVMRMRTGRGVKLAQEGHVAVAEVLGMVVQPEPDRFEVHEILEVRGDVDFASGHITFPGLVKVHGAILPDFKVRCGNLEVETMEPGSMAEVTGDMKVDGGIMGAAVKVGGSVQARYIRQSKLVGGGDIYVSNELVGSVVQCGGVLRITSPSGRIVNSQVAAVRGVSTGDIVSSGKGNTVIRLGVSDAFVTKIASLKHTIEKLKREEKQLFAVVQGELEELEATEKELRSILGELNKKGNEENRENLLAQVRMIKPIRENLKAGVDEGNQRLEDIIYEMQQLSDRLTEMEALVPTGAVWLDVRGAADSSTEIAGPHASLVLNRSQAAFSCRESELKDPDGGAPKIVMKISPLRSGAK